MSPFAQALTEWRTLADRAAALTPAVDAAGAALRHVLRSGGKILTCGNGGSAADALHLAEELTGKYDRPRRALAALCLNADGTALTCIANDFGYEQVFARQIEALGRPGDALVTFTTSGRSPNILAALAAARSRGLVTVTLTGKDGGAAAPASDHALVMPSHDTARIQELHTVVLHAWLAAVEMETWP